MTWQLSCRVIFTDGRQGVHVHQVTTFEQWRTQLKKRCEAQNNHYGSVAKNLADQRLMLCNAYSFAAALRLSAATSSMFLFHVTTTRGHNGGNAAQLDTTATTTKQAQCATWEWQLRLSTQQADQPDTQNEPNKHCSVPQYRGINNLPQVRRIFGTKLIKNT